MDHTRPSSVVTVTVVGERVEELQATIEKRFEDDSVSLKATIEQMRTEINDSAEALVALQKQKK